MAIDFTKFFGVFEEFVDHSDEVEGWIGDLLEDEAQIEDAFRDNGISDLIDDLPDLFIGLQNDVTGWITNNLKSRVTDLILNQGLVLDEISLISTPTVRVVLEEIFKDMVDQNETIPGTRLAEDTNDNIVYDTVHTDPFSVFIEQKLDGTTPPANDILPFVRWNGESSALFISQTLDIRCTQDSEHGTFQGNETFQIRYGQPNGPFRAQNEGAGAFQTSTNNSKNIVPQGTFDGYTVALSDPPGWTSTDASVLTPGSGVRGTACLTITGQVDTIETEISPTQLTRNKLYGLSVLVKCANIDGGTGTLTLEDDGGTLNALPIDLADADTDWTLLYSRVVIPAELEGTPKIVITNPIAFGAGYLIDDIVLAPISFYSGLPLSIFALDAKTLIGDNAVVLIQPEEAGAVQEFIRKQFRFQLPQFFV